MAHEPLPMLRNSERTDFKRCVLRWHWRYNEHLVPVEFSTGPLLFGSLGHLCMPDWYIPGTKRGRHPAETWDEITTELWDSVKVEKFVDDEVGATWEDAKALGREMLVAYVDHYGLEEHIEVLWAEEQFHQVIPHPLLKGKAIVEGVGTIDLIYRNHVTGLLEYMDHKFMKTIQTEHLYIDTQNGGYLAIGTHEARQRGLIGPKEAVRVLVYNFLRKAKQDTRPVNEEGKRLNKDGSVSKSQPAPYFHRERIERTAAERNQEIRQLGEDALWLKAVRAGKLPITKNPTMNCHWDCQFFDMCNIHSNGDPEELDYIKTHLFRREDPYAEYRGETQPKIIGGRKLMTER